jgi:dipeptidyl aminopeptidase/acylaminoacyl peptidase
MKTTRLCLAVLLPLFALSASAADGVPDRPAAGDSLGKLLDSLSAVRRYSEVTLSPDGRRIAWVENLPTKDDDPARDSAVFVAEVGPPAGEPRRITAGDGRTPHAEHSPAWAPDGRLAFLSDRDKKGQLQAYLAPADGGKPRRLTDLSGRLADPRWSPDGKRLAVLFTEGAQGKGGPVGPAAPELGEVGEHPPEQRLCLLDTDSGRLRPLSPAGLHAYEYDWSPDSTRLAVVAAPPPGDDNWYVARLYTLLAESGEMRLVLKPGMQIGAPCWSPDGKRIAFVGGLMSDEGVIGGDIYTVPAAGGPARNLTPSLPFSASWLAWLSDPERILFAGHADGGSIVAELDPAGGRLRTLWGEGESISAQGWGPSLSLSRDGKVSALIRQSFARPPEVWAGPIGGWRPVTQANRDLRPAWGEARSLHWKSDEWEVQGWLLYPRDFDPKRRYPLLVSVHGGPASARRPAWPGTSFDLSVLAHEGYFVLFPNPRGSYGRGEAFTRANVKDFGHGDLRDILAGVDEAARAAPVDLDRVGIAGWSYGGYMTMWAVTQTGRFRAAVAGAGIANWQSYYGQNGIDQWLLPYFGATVYDDPEVYARSSPISFIKKVKTPTLVLVGERDAECPPAQSREFWHALRTLGVPSRLVVYPGEGHGIARPSHRRDILRRTVGWMNRYLRPTGAPRGK